MAYEPDLRRTGSVLDIRVGEADFVCTTRRPPWRYVAPANQFAVLYGTTTGRMVIEVDGAEPLTLEPGSVVSLVEGQPHRAADSVAALASKNSLNVDLHAGEDSEPSKNRNTHRVFAARVPITANPLPNVLAPVIHVTANDQPIASRLQQVLELAVAFQRAPEKTRQPVLKRVAEILAIELTDFALSRDGGEWISRISDTRIQRAIGVMRVNPSRSWTVSELADEARMSRSAFAARFRATMGIPPMDYLRRCRMEMAMGLLIDTDLPLYTVANRTGYQSESAFARAFERVAGDAPGRYRRRRRAN